MRITHTIYSLRPELGGPSISAPALSTAIAAQGGSVDMAVWEERGEARPLDMDNGIPLRNGIPSVMVHGGMGRRKLQEHVKRNDVAILHDHSLWRRYHVGVAWVARQTGRPLVLSPRGTMLPWCLEYKRFKKQIGLFLYQRRILEAVDLFHVTSEEEATSIRNAGLRQPMALIPNGTVLPDLEGPLRTNGQQEPGSRTALFLSRLNPKKGLLMLVEAWARTRPSGWKLQIVGPDEGNYGAVVKAAIARESLSDTISIYGPVDHEEKWHRYRAADLFILPTHSENFGIVVGEALASGTPVLTTKGAPWSELETRQCGWWSDISVEGLAAALAEATSLPSEDLRLMGARGRRLIEDRYSWQAIGRDMLSAYRWLLKAGEKPDTIILD